MKVKTTAVVLLGFLTLVGCAKKSETVSSDASVDPPEVNDSQLWEDADLRFQALPTSAPNPENEVTRAKVDLGKKLYFDNQLSEQGTISCNSCHDLANFGVDSLPTSPGDDGGLGGRNSPTVLNAALHGTQFWDGRAKDVEEQAGMPILNSVEMAIPSEEFLVERLSGSEEYQRMFVEAFPDETESLTYLNIQKALAAFERTLLTPSPFDDFLLGNQDALSAEAKTGLQTFIRLGCTACHNGVNVGANSFQKFGLHGNYWEHTGSTEIDEGREQVTQDEADRYFFRVASLRNVEKTAPYFHDGSVETLEEAVRVMVRIQLGMELTDQQVSALAAFLRSLTGEVPAEAQQTAGG